jgi:UDP-4-amino-4-deoxy-L-arabinose-oxoglutarate aminotransferase
MGRPGVPFFLHGLGEEELASLAEVLAGPILTTGRAVDRFERRFADYLGCRHVVGTTSCTGALHIALEAMGIGSSDEVITTPMTFIATATAIIQAGARPVFVDVEPDTANLDASRIEQAITPRTRAVLPVHLYGQMCDMRRIRAIADRHDLAVIEDAAQCIEGRRDGVRVGELADAACFSFYATKSITCGEGGAVAFDRDDLVEPLRLLRHHGMNRIAADRDREGYSHWDMLRFGWKYNMDDIHAALLLPQVERIDSRRERRAALFRRYRDGLDGVAGAAFPATRAETRHACHMFTVWVPPSRRDEIVAGLHAEGIPVMVNYRAVHLMTYFRESFGGRRGEFPVAERIGDSTLTLPLYPDMPDEHVDTVVAALRRLVAGESPAAGDLSCTG